MRTGLFLLFNDDKRVKYKAGWQRVPISFVIFLSPIFSVVPRYIRNKTNHFFTTKKFNAKKYKKMKHFSKC